MIDRDVDDLEFGLFDWIDAQPEVPIGETYAARLRLARRAEDLGFVRYHLAEHHGTPLGLAPSPALLLAALARETTTLRLVATTFIVPLYDPLRLTEEIGMLDQLSGGRLEIGVGKGSSPIEAAMFGNDPAASAALYDAALPAILAALETGTFVWPEAYAGRTADPVTVYARPAQSPHPPLWYPTSNAASLPRLAAEGYSTIFGFGFASPPLETVQARSREFFADAAPAADGSVPRFGMLRHVYVGRDDDEAMRTAGAALTAHYESFTHLWRAAGDERYRDGLDLADLVRRHLIFVGSARTVAEQVAHAVGTAEVNYLAGAFAWGSLTEQESAASLDRFAAEVIPAVRAAARSTARTA